MKTVKVLFLILVFGQKLFSQNTHEVDSLLKVLPTLNEDSLRVKTYVKIGNRIVFKDPKKALEYGELALQLAEKIKWNKGIGLAYSTIGDAHENQGNNALALKIRLLELEKWKSLNRKIKVCGTLANIGVSYSNLGDNLKALEYYLASLKLAEETDQKKTIVNNEINIATIYYEQKNYKTALEYYNKALKTAEQNNFENIIAVVKVNLGQIFSAEGDQYKAIIYYTEALEISKKLERKMYMTACYGNIGQAYTRLADSAETHGDIDLSNKTNALAMESYQKGLKIAQELEDEYMIAGLTGNIGYLYKTIGQYEHSEIYLKKSLALATKMNAIDVIRDDNHRLSKLYKAINKPLLALEHYERFATIIDSISSSENKKALAELQVKYDTEKKESENKALAQQNKILELSVTNTRFVTIGLIIILLLILSIGFLITRQNKLRSRQENVRLEQKLLRTQMNPHFIFNSLTGIESFIYEHQPKEAGNYLSQFARLMRLILENSAEEYISLDKEIETLNYYLSLQKLRLNDNLKYTIDVDLSIKTSQIFIPPMLTQPFLENSIEHGFRGLKECGEIELNYRLKDNHLEIRITDNGIGIIQGQQQKDLYKEHKSMAMQITYERLKFLNRSKKQKLVFSIRELTERDEKKGTEVLFSIPI
jgi:tetratricopeptide (TPR) repeat protein